jgi:tetratricopeptide (TPR) repeat protein
MDNDMPTLRFISPLLFLVFIATSSPVHSESYVPKSNQSIVASWTVPKPAQQPKIFIAQLLNDASKPGLASRYYGRAGALLKPLLVANPNDLELQFYSATVLQHYHQFNQAQQLLTQILQYQPDNVAAWLMKANIHMVQGDLDAAKNACLQVLGQGSLFVSSACVLEVSAEQGNVAQSYQQLKNIVKVAGDIPIAQQVWLNQILADLAHRQQLTQQAIDHLSGYPLNQAPVSYLALWADIYLAQQQGQIVLETLGPIVEESDSFDDALLLRLTLAEQITKATNGEWQQRLTQRIEIRLQRNDTAHAADIAQYYLDIVPNPIKALYWARINWQQAKLGSDERLLKRALAFKESPDKKPQI